MKNKIIFYSDLIKLSEQIKKKGKVVILATGVFDLFHAGHKQFLQKAKDLGGILFVGVESDLRVKKLKGEKRPLDKLTERMNNVASFTSVDYVFSLPDNFGSEKEILALLRNLQPDYLSVSSHTKHQKQKRELMKKIQGELKVVMKQDKNISTSKLIKSLKKTS
ncbi:adenylyltransferase/cytidyltransferase family protein [Candidatus Beckwithbacteria bacterium]|nr:adenylyltransferase/cytidyltransferase family protein [Candidatus Beckwithbacteria bacterium]